MTSIPAAVLRNRRARQCQTVPLPDSYKAIAAIAAFLFILYVCFPTKNHYWDGIGFALDIEGIGQDGNGVVRNDGDFHGVPSIYFNPNHLFFNLIGYLAYRPLHAVFPGLRALAMLQAISILLSVSTACLLFLTLHRWLRDLRLSVWLTLLMALSASWWKFSTDANTYVASTFLLMLGAYLMTDSVQRPSAWKIGRLHALSMVLHQISIFFLPAALFALWNHPYWLERSERRKSVVRYLLAGAIPVAAAYAWVWFGVLDQSWSLRGFAAWLTSNAGDTLAFQSVGANALESLRSLLRVFFGGRIRMAFQFVNPRLLTVLLAVMLFSLVRLVWALAKTFAVPPPAAPSDSYREPALPSPGFVAVWAGTFIAFLFFWLTEYPYYRFFCLPALIFLVGAFVRSRRSTRQATTVLASFVVFMAAFNFTAYIYPYSHAEATPPIRLAQEASSMWNSDAVVLYKEFTCDNWMMRYFSPRTTWLQANLDDQEHLAGLVETALTTNRQLWMDTTLLGQLRDTPAAAGLLERYGGFSQPWGLVNAKHNIQFAQLLPR